MGTLSGQAAIITGGGRGIGKAIALRLAQEGANVAIAARSTEELNTVANEMAGLGVRCLVLPTDVTDPAQLEVLVETVIKAFGRIDVLVNNAGGGPPRAPVSKARVSDWDWTLRTNLWATMVLSKLVLPIMIDQQRGAIVNMASLAGKEGKPGEAAYAAAKFGVMGFSQSLFAEVREYGIKVTTICPGYVDTRLIPANRRVDRTKMIRPQDVAEVVYGVVTSAISCCPTEIIIYPQRDPFK
jgi:NAD(P)-dependent dehydrogenase (short-subunit alcohol dehydrogenase family)